MGHRAGDNSQVQALAEALGWPYEVKRFAYKPYELMTNLTLGPTLAGTVKSRSSSLGAPWPDLVISAGRRNEPVCRWIQQQADKPVQLVHVGRPWAHYDRFDLVVTTPQYRLPRHPKILHNNTPLHRIDSDKLAEAAREWAPRFAHLPRPHIAVVIGGNSGPYSMNARAAERLAHHVNRLARAQNGSLLITTSARTPDCMVEALERLVDVPAHLYKWAPDARENPYFGYLGLADEIVVTGDSVSMLTEACATCKPVFIFDVGEGKYSMRGEATAEEDFELSTPVRPDSRAWFYRQAMRYGPRRLTRDIRIVHRFLVSTGRAVWLGDDFDLAGRRPQPLEDVPRAAARIRGLFEPRLAEAAMRLESAEAEVLLRRTG